MTISVKIIADSVHAGKRITTFQLKFHRFILPEFNTHRVFSRNASSSRAIPILTLIKQVLSDPAMPVEWGKNQRGMQARENMTGLKLELAKLTWLTASKVACLLSYTLSKLGLHKQIANRITEPWQWSNVVVTSTEWSNFLELRDHKDAQPEIRRLATLIRRHLDLHNPRMLMIGEWHLPYVTEEEILIAKTNGTYNTLPKISSARCARVSYLKHDGTLPNVENDIELFSQLVVRPFTDKRGNVLTETDPIHGSPIEHQATPFEDVTRRSNNFVGWQQYREIFNNNKGQL